MSISRCDVIFFDLGDTLVKKVPGSARRGWIEHAKEGLQELKAKGARLGLLSNTGNLTREQLFNDLLPVDFTADLFEDQLIILSSEVGVEKPDFQIFAHAIDRADVAPIRCLFCTEDLSHTLAAQEVGMRAVWLPMGTIGQMVNALVGTNLWSR